MLSSSGRATLTPRPRRTVRRERDLLVMNIVNSFCSLSGSRHYIRRSPHLERLAGDHTQNKRRPAILRARGVPYNRANRGLVGVSDRPAQSIGHEFFGEIPDELFFMRQQRLAEFSGIREFRAIQKHAG